MPINSIVDKLCYICKIEYYTITKVRKLEVCTQHG